MKKIDTAKTISILANLGVLAGILLLAFELNQNNELLRAEADYIYFQTRIANRQDIITDPSYAALWVKISNNESLTEAEQYRLDKHIESTLLAWQWEYGQVADENLREGYPEMVKRYRRGLDGINGFASRFPYVWAYFWPELREDFVKWMAENVID